MIYNLLSNKLLNTVAVSLFFSFTIKAQSLYFPPNTGNAWDTISPSSLNYCSSQIDSLYAFLDSNNTKAFILLKDGKIVLEKYFGTHTKNSLWQWASAGKTITSFLIGIAQQEGRLSISDTTSNIIGQGWTNCTPAQENKITIRHQLTMTSGLDDGVPDNHCFKDSCLIYKTDAGTRWAYHNGPYTILDSVINISTGLTLNQYATQKIKNPIGMTGAFVTTGSDHVYFSNARSMARFGLLILNKGNWNGTQLLTDTNYYNQMLNSSQSLNKSYGYLWWLNGKSSFMVPSAQMVFPGSLCPNAPSNMIAAMGKNGQFINIVPDKKLVWIRMGNSPENSLVPFFLDDDIWKYINKLECNTTFVKPLETTSFKVNYYLYPNTNSLTVRANQPLSNFKIITLQGQVVKDIFLKNNELETTLSINDLVNGLYFINITSINGDKFAGKMLKQ